MFTNSHMIRNVHYGAKPYQILDESRAPLPMRPGDIRKIDSEYVRNGTVSIFCFIQPHTGRILHSVEPTRTAVDWAEKIKYLADEVEPEAEKIVLAKATEAAGLDLQCAMQASETLFKARNTWAMGFTHKL